MANKRGTKYEDFEAELLKKPEIRREYEALKPKYEMIKILIERRNQLRISQTQLAKTIGTKQPAISRLERRDYNTTLDTLFKVASALDLNIDISSKIGKVTKSAYNKLHA
jgi:DNA-binding XRE family transcriptional regulator